MPRLLKAIYIILNRIKVKVICTKALVFIACSIVLSIGGSRGGRGTLSAKMEIKRIGQIGVWCPT